MSGYRSTPPDCPTLPKTRKTRRFSPLKVTAALVGLLVVTVLFAVYLAATYATNNQAAEDSRIEGLIVVESQTDLHDISDPLPADISAEDYAAFWAEPALNTPDALALLDLINEGWKARLAEDHPGDAELMFRVTREGDNLMNSSEHAPMRRASCRRTSMRPSGTAR